MELRDLVRARAGIDGQDKLTWFSGDVHAMVPGQAGQKLLGFEGWNVARAVPAEDGWDLLTREAVLYLDPRTREPLERWTNPFTGAEVDVVHIWNDPVNQKLRPRFPLPVTDLGDELCCHLEIFLAYPSPLPRAQFPDNSQDDLYQAAELFGFHVSKDELASDAESIGCKVTWTRIAPWLPFMAMGDRPGHLVYTGRGRNLAYSDVREPVRAYIEERHPEYRTAPSTFTEPNETSWTYFRKIYNRSMPSPTK